jgi:Flp pilus assembly protein TadG
MRRLRGARMLWRDRRGVSAIEFGLVAPTLVLLLYAFIEIGRAVFCYNSLSHAVYEAGRYAIVHGSESSAPANSDAIAAQVESAATWLDPSAISVVTTWSPDNSPGSEVTVEATYAFEPLLNLIDFASFDMDGRLSMVIAR